MFIYKKENKEIYSNNIELNLKNTKFNKIEYCTTPIVIGDKVTFKSSKNAITKHSEDGSCWNNESGIVIQKFNKVAGFRNYYFQIEEVLVIKLDNSHNFFIHGLKTDIVQTNILDKEILNLKVNKKTIDKIKIMSDNI
jgi:hypothetical protein